MYPDQPASQATPPINTTTKSSTTVSTRLMSIAELVELISQHLPRRDLIRFSQVNHFIYSLTTPMIWRHLDLTTYNMDALIGSSGWIASWNRNCELTQSLVLPTDLSWVYLAATIGDQQGKAPWIFLPRPGPEVFVRVPLQPVTGLKNLKCVTTMCRSTRFINHPVVMVFSHYGLLGPIEHRLQYTSNLPAAWVISHNPGLESLEFTTFQCRDPISGRTFIRAISCLQNLRRLKCSNRDYSIVPVEFVIVLLRGLPPSVESITMDFCVDFGNNHHSLFEELLNEGDSTDVALGPLVERVGPLSCLNELKMPCHIGSYTGDELVRILESCPALERLVIPQNVEAEVGVRLANTIREHCPHLRHWSICRPTNPLQPGPLDEQILDELFTHLPPEHMDSLTWKGLHEGPGSNNIHVVPLTVFVLRRFLDTLTQLRFINTLRISSATIQWILTSCAALKSFTIESRVDKRSFITLEDAIQTPWMCTGIEKLHIGVEVETVAVPQPDDERWAMWGTLARLIGRLTKLRRLCLLALPPVDHPGHGSGVYIQYTLPGFLTLDPRPDKDIVPVQDTDQGAVSSNDVEAAANAKSEGVNAAESSPPVEITDPVVVVASATPEQIDTLRTGFLCHLGALTNLQELQGSFHVNRNTFSDLEIDWIRNHWPKLRMLEFCNVENSAAVDDLPAPVKRFRDEFGFRVRAYPEESEERFW